MKTFRLFLLIIAAISVLCIGCNDDEADDIQPITADSIVSHSWTDHFYAASDLYSNWSLIGEKTPKWENSVNGREGLFDNNGPSPTRNFAISRAKIGQCQSFRIETEVMVSITNPYGACVCPGIAVSREKEPVMDAETNDILTNFSIRIVFVGNLATWFPNNLRGHTWLLMDYWTESGTVETSGYKAADLYAGDWHVLKIEVPSSRLPLFYCDDKLVWAPTKFRAAPMKTDKRIILGYTSGGNADTKAGVAYHNWVSVNYLTLE